jgi:heat shock protein HslJ
MRGAAITLFAVLVLAACSTSGAPEDLVGRTWTLESVEGVSALPAGVAAPTIRFAPDGHFSGSTGCNNGGASYRVEGKDRLVIEAMMMTKRACLSPEGNALERAYVGAIDAAATFRVANDGLELLADDGRVVARFR